MLALKETQETLDHEGGHLFADVQATAVADCDADAAPVESGYGRVEILRYWTISDPVTLAHRDPDGAWAGLRGIGMVEAERREKANVTHETRSYLTSLTEGETRILAALVRVVDTPALGRRRQTAMSIASITHSEQRCSAIAQPTIRRL